MNWKGFGRVRWWPNLRSCPGICLKGMRKPRKNSVMIAVFSAEIRTRHLPNIKTLQFFLHWLYSPPSTLFHWLYSPPWALASAFSFMIILQTVGLLGRVISLSQGLYLNTGQHKHRINTYTHQTSMPWVGFETTIPAFGRAKTVHALDRAATAIVHSKVNVRYKRRQM
jgi:hypothetical protein